MILEIIVGVLGISTLIVILLALRAPMGREIPSVGFVRDDTLELTLWDIVPGEVGDPQARKLLHGNGGRG